VQLLGGSKEIINNLSHVNLCPSRDSKQAALVNKSQKRYPFSCFARYQIYSVGRTRRNLLLMVLQDVKLIPVFEFRDCTRAQCV